MNFTLFMAMLLDDVHSHAHDYSVLMQKQTDCLNAANLWLQIVHCFEEKSNENLNVKHVFFVILLTNQMTI